MKTWRARIFACGVVLLSLVSGKSLQAQIDVGTWVRAEKDSMSGMTLTVEACCGGGRRLTWHFVIGSNATVMVVESRLDGSDAPVLIGGKPSGETMAIKRLDDHHSSTIVTLNGKAFGTSEATLSADGRTLTVHNDFSSSGGGQAVGKTTEIWVRK